MTLRFVSAFELGEINGTQTFTGTGLGTPAPDGDIDVSDFNDEFFYGQIANIGNTDARITLVFAGEGVGFVTHQLRRQEVMTIEGIPLRAFRVFVDGTTTIKAQGFILKAENASDFIAAIHEAKIRESFNDLGAAAGLTFPTYDHTDIAAATTTTLATPVAADIIRVYKITIGVQAAIDVTLRWTDSDGSSNPNDIGTLPFGGKGVFVYDFGDRGLLCPNGADGLLRAITSNAIDVDIDVISEDVSP